MSDPDSVGEPATAIAALRETAVAERWARACRHLDEAKVGVATDPMPVATVHSAYYAMHHAARAVIISRLTGTLRDQWLLAMDLKRIAVDIQKHAFVQLGLTFRRKWKSILFVRLTERF